METFDFQKCCESKVIATNQSFLLRENCPQVHFNACTTNVLQLQLSRQSEQFYCCS